MKGMPNKALAAPACSLWVACGGFVFSVAQIVSSAAMVLATLAK
jgi:hypothetical protein